MRRAVRIAIVVEAMLLAARVHAETPPLRVASKSFTESVVLGEVARLLAEDAGATVVHRAGLGGTRLVWQALLAGGIDLYPEYTGTLIQEILRTRDFEAALAAQGLAFIGPLGFNNTYALGMRAATARERRITRISDLGRHKDLRYGLSNEFMSRADGWPGLRDRYGLQPSEPAQPLNVRGLDHDLAYRGLVAGSIDVVDLYATDAEIAEHGLRVLEDDRQHFPRYDAIVVYRQDAERRWPAAFAALRRLHGTMSDAEMAALNAAVKIGRKPEAEVAAGFLASHFPPKLHPPKRRASRGLDNGRRSTSAWLWSRCWQRSRRRFRSVSSPPVDARSLGCSWAWLA